MSTEREIVEDLNNLDKEDEDNDCIINEENNETFDVAKRKVRL